jgi:hypothetical protein
MFRVDNGGGDEHGSFLPTENMIYDAQSISDQTHAWYSY